MNTDLSAAQITELTKGLTDIPLGRLATAAKTAERFQRFLAQQISEERAVAAAPLILQGATLEIARERLASALLPVAPSETVDIADLHPTSHPIAAANAASWPGGARRRTRSAPLEAAAKEGRLPAPPDFSAPTHARFRTKLGQIVALAEAGDIEGLRAVPINPVSSSPKALARYRDRCVTALQVRAGSAAAL